MPRGRKATEPALDPITDPEDRAAMLRDCKHEHDLLENKIANQRELVKALNKQKGNMFRRLKTQLGITRDSIEHHFSLLNIEDEDVRAQRLAEMRELYAALPLGESADLFPEGEDEGAGEHAAGVIHEPGTNGKAGLTYEDGRQAGLAGKTAADNPFGKRLKAHQTWESGRMAGQAELANDLDPEAGTAEPDERRPGQAPRSRRRSASEAPAGTA